MLLWNDGKLILDFIDREDGESDFFASPALQAEGASCNLLFCNIVVHRHLDDVSETALDISHDRKVLASERRRLQTVRESTAETAGM